MSGILSVSPDMNSGILGGADGTLLSTKTYRWNDGNCAFTTGTMRIAKEFIPYTLTATNTYVLVWSAWFGACATSTTAERRIYPKVAMWNQDPGNPTDTPNGSGTYFLSGLLGRVMVSASSTGACSYGMWTSQSIVPPGTSGTKWFGLMANSDGSAATATIYADANSQLNFTINEYAGNVAVHNYT